MTEDLIRVGDSIELTKTIGFINDGFLGLGMRGRVTEVCDDRVWADFDNTANPVDVFHTEMRKLSILKLLAEI